MPDPGHYTATEVRDFFHRTPIEAAVDPEVREHLRAIRAWLRTASDREVLAAWAEYRTSTENRPSCPVSCQATTQEDTLTCGYPETCGRL